jgi:hypothetical protein
MASIEDAKRQTVWRWERADQQCRFSSCRLNELRQRTAKSVDLGRSLGTCRGYFAAIQHRQPRQNGLAQILDARQNDSDATGIMAQDATRIEQRLIDLIEWR